MTQDLSGRVAIVVGGETEQGRAAVIGLAEAGADVAIVTLTADTKAEFAINSALNELWAMQRKGLALAIDASDAAQVREALALAEAELGRPHAAVAVDEASVAANELRSALGDDAVLTLGADVAVEDVVRFVAGWEAP